MPAPMRAYRIAAIPGDGIGVEVIAAGLRALQEVAAREGSFRLEVESFPWSSDYYLERGYYIPEGGLEKLRGFDAIFFGAVGSQKVPDHISLWGLRLPICQGFDQYANVRPARVLPGVTSPLRAGQGIDWVVVRENSEGEYAGHGGRAHRGQPGHRTHRQFESRAPFPVHVRADPWIRFRHRRQGDRESHRHLLDGRADARAPGRAGRGAPPDVGGRVRHRERRADARPGRLRQHRGSHPRGLRRALRRTAP